MKKNDVVGLRVFLLFALKLLAEGEAQESCTEIENNILKGQVATALAKKYKDKFEETGFSVDDVKSVDEYFQTNWGGGGDGNEKKYMCEEKNGLQLLIALALNEF